MDRQSDEDRARQMLRLGYGADDFVASVCGEFGSDKARQEARTLFCRIRLDMRRDREHADLGRMER